MEEYKTVIHVLRTQEVKGIEDFPVETIRHAMRLWDSLTAEEQDELSMPELHHISTKAMKEIWGSERKQFGMRFRMLGSSSLRVVECWYPEE